MTQQDQAHVLPPFAAPAGQHDAGFIGKIDAGVYDPETGNIRITVKLPIDGLPTELLTIGAMAAIAPASKSSTAGAAKGGNTIHCQEFHELAMDYRGASPLHANAAYDALCNYIERRFASIPPLTAPAPLTDDLIQRFASWIMVNRPKHHIDHACARCVPHGDMVIEGFSCVYHEAVDVVGGIMPAAAKAAPAAPVQTTEPDQLTDEAIDEVFNAMPGGVDGWLKQFGYRQFARSIARHTLVRVAASMAGTIRPTDDELWEQTIGERDCYHEWADKLANAIAKHFGTEIGEHSNMNCPWAEAMEVIAAAPVQAEQAQAEIPAILFDGFAVYADLTRHIGKNHCYSPDAVSATLDAVVRLMRKEGALPAHAEQAAAVRAATIQEIAAWYDDKGWLMDEGDVADAIRDLAKEAAIQAPRHTDNNNED